MDRTKLDEIGDRVHQQLERGRAEEEIELIDLAISYMKYEIAKEL